MEGIEHPEHQGKKDNLYEPIEETNLTPDTALKRANK